MQPEHDDRERAASGLTPPPAGGTPEPAGYQGGPTAGRPAEAGSGSGVPAGEMPGGAPKVGGTRTSSTWGALAAGLIFLIVILVFILENLKSVRVHFFGATWSIPLGVDLLLAAVLGGLVMFTAGAARILQLRRAARVRAGGGRHRGGTRRGRSQSAPAR